MIFPQHRQSGLPTRQIWTCHSHTLQQLPCVPRIKRSSLQEWKPFVWQPPHTTPRSDSCSQCQLHGPLLLIPAWSLCVPAHPSCAQSSSWAEPLVTSWFYSIASAQELCACSCLCRTCAPTNPYLLLQVSPGGYFPQ